MSEYKYQSPIEPIQDEIEMRMEGEIVKAVQKVGINVNKDELLKALAYDRDQYNKGYHDAQPEQRWIPCSESLPEKHGEMYLVTISDGGVYSFALQWDINRKQWYLSFLNNGESLIEYIDDVIAWMPLPEPYGERRADET